MAKIFKANQIKIDTEKPVFIHHHQKIVKPEPDIDPAEDAFAEEAFRALSPEHLAGNGEKIITKTPEEGSHEPGEETPESVATPPSAARKPESFLSQAARKSRHAAALEAIKVKELELEAKANPQAVRDAAKASMCVHVEAMLAFHAQGIPTVDYGNNLRQRAFDNGVKDAFNFPGFVPAYIRPLFCEGKGPFRWVALSGDPEDIYRTDEAIMELFPEDEHLHRWLVMAKEKIHFQGLPSRICWLGYGERAKAGLKFNEMVARGVVKAPIVIGRDHLDSGSVASPNRETEGMRDGTDAVSDWPILNAMINAVGGATWVSFHHGGGVGIGFSQHAGQVIVADGTPAAARRLERVLTSDPGMGVVRHVDAGYPEALAAARRGGIKIPMMKKDES